MGRPHYISEENWQKMSWKERDYVGLLMERKYSKADIKRKLYITTDQWFWKLRNRVKKFINLVDCKTT